MQSDNNISSAIEQTDNDQMFFMTLIKRVIQYHNLKCGMQTKQSSEIGCFDSQCEYFPDGLLHFSIWACHFCVLFGF